MKIANLIADLGAKISPAARAELHHIIKTPEFEAIREREENRVIEHRLALIASMKKIPSEHKAAIAHAEKQCIATTARIETLHHEAIAARAAHVAANAAAMAAELAPRVALLEAEKELRRTADPRLGDFIFILDGKIDDRIRNSWKFTEFRTQNKWTGQGIAVIESNMQDIVAARAVLQDSIAELDAMRLEAVTRDEVTKRLNKMSASLTTVLTPFDLAPPVLNELGEVIWERKTPSFEAMQAANLAPKDGSKWVDGKLQESKAGK